MTKSYHCIITMEGVRTKKEFLQNLQVMLDDYDDMNELNDNESVTIRVGKPYKEESMA